MRKLLSVLVGFVLWSSPGVAIANSHSIAREMRADNGVKVTRDDIQVDCQESTQAGFVFNDVWQGVGDDEGWLEIGTSYCDLGAPAPKWVWAKKDPITHLYFEDTLKFNAGNGTHAWTIINTNSGGQWELRIDGEYWVIVWISSGGYANSADVGLEVSDRANSTQPSTVESTLWAWPTRASSEPWAERDYCERTRAEMSGHWNSDIAWRHSLNVSGLPNSDCA